MKIDIVWEGQRWPVDISETCTSAFGDYFYTDFVTLLEALGEDGRQQLIDTARINHPEAFQEDHAGKRWCPVNGWVKRT